MKEPAKKWWSRSICLAAGCLLGGMVSGQSGFHIAASKFQLQPLPDPVVNKTGPYRHPVMLPWSAECLPFFCKIEHNMGLKSKVPMKFRLGSVEYVDWLEGKSKRLGD